MEIAVEFGPVLHDFLADDSFVRAVTGPFGSGKSTACCFDMLVKAAGQVEHKGLRRSRWAVVRNTYPQLQDTTRRTWDDLTNRLGLAGCVKWQESENIAVFRRDGIELELMFRALDRPADVAKLLSLELTGAWLNEAREIPKPIFEAIQGRVGRFPSVADGGTAWCGIILDTNPPDEDSWFYRVFEELRPPGFKVFHQPSGRSPEAENIENLVPGYYDRLAAGKDEDFIRVYVDGCYGFVRDGRPVYPEWRDTVHVRELEPRPGTPLIVGMDFGLTPAAVICQRGPDGRLEVLDELVSEDMGAVTFAGLLRAKLAAEYPGRPVRGWGDPAGEQRNQVDERTPFDVVQAAGLPIHHAPTNDFTLRREAVAGLLLRMTMLAQPALAVSPKCRTLRKAMGGGYCYRRIQVTGTEKFADKPDKNAFSHVAEALQYAAVGEGEDVQAIHGDRSARPSALKFKVHRSVQL